MASRRGCPCVQEAQGDDRIICDLTKNEWLKEGRKEGRRETETEPAQPATAPPHRPGPGGYDQKLSEDRGPRRMRRCCCALLALSHGSVVGGSFVPPASVRRPRAALRPPCHLCLSMRPSDEGVPVVGGGGPPQPHGPRRWRHYASMMRPVTVVQAAGAFLVGRLALLAYRPATGRALVPLAMASASVYLAYGAGMAMNDCADAAVDARHATKQNRSVASEIVSVRDGWMFCLLTSMVSVAFACLASLMTQQGQTAIGGFGFVGWTAANLALMASYALGLQKILFVKNILCGLFAISPLIGASLLGDMPSLGKGTATKLYQLAAIGFPLQISREVLKDIEDVDADRGEKQTLPLVIGEKSAKRVAYGLVGAVNAAMLLSPYYWKMFASKPPLYAISVAVGTPMCIVASRLPLSKGQRLLKKSIYVLLLGMISGLLLQ